jgi:hypothetical protein
MTNTITFPNVSINGTTPGTITDTQMAGYGFLASITVNGTAYPAWQAVQVAAMLQANLNATAAGGGSATIWSAFSTSTSSADPGSGKVALNNAAMASVTAIYLSATDAYSNAVGALITACLASTNSTKAVITIRHQTNSTKFVTFSVSAVTNNTTWQSLTVTNLVYSAASPFAASDPLAISFSIVGNIGSGNLTYQSTPITANGTTIVAGNAYLIDTTSAAFTITAPASASVGDRFSLTDISGKCATNNLTIAANGLKFPTVGGGGAVANFIIDKANVSITFVYSGATQGWVLA